MATNTSTKIDDKPTKIEYVGHASIASISVSDWRKAGVEGDVKKIEFSRGEEKDIASSELTNAQLDVLRKDRRFKIS